MMTPLNGLRILDLSRVLAGPWATQLLADLGAEVIKVERPGRGDDSRIYGPPFLKERDGSDSAESIFYLSVNRNKQSVTVDLAHPEGQRVIRELAKVSDVVVENFRVGALARYGLDAKSLCELNPRLIYCSITGFGQTGPLKDNPGYDTIFQAMSGLMSVTGEKDGPPMKVGPSVIDLFTGLYAALAITAAAYRRDRHSSDAQGEIIDLALLDVGIAVMAHPAMVWLNAGQIVPRRGTEGNGGMPSQMFACSDGHIVVVCGNDEQYRRFVGVLGLERLGTDPQFAKNVARMANRNELTSLLAPAVASFTVNDLLSRLATASVPAGPVCGMQEVFENAQVQSRRVVTNVNHPLKPDLALIDSPIHFSRSAPVPRRPPPMLGDDTIDVLGRLLSLSREEIAALRADRVI